LSPQSLHDYRVLRAAIAGELFTFEDMQSFTGNPMTYAGVFDVSVYIKRDFAPLEDRIRSIIVVEKEAPRVMAAARANLKDSLAQPYVETAMDVANGSADFLGKELVESLKEVKNESLMAEFNAVNKNAIAEIRRYAEWLKNEKLPKAHNHYSLGREKFQGMLRNGELAGILSERDIMNRVVAVGRTPGTTAVSEVMTANPRSVPADETVEECLFIMREFGFRHLPIMDGKELKGLVSLRDILMRHAAELERKTQRTAS